MSAISVLAAPLIDPGAGRVELTVTAGATIAEIVAQALPGADEERLHLRVTLTTPKGMIVVEAAFYHRIRPRPGVQVVIRVLPGKNALRAILSIVVAVAALALGQYWGAALASSSMGMLSVQGAQGLIGLGVSMIGNALINALIPPVTPKGPDKPKPNYAISSWKNELRPDGVIPDIYGRHRYAPPFAAPPYSEVVGDWIYVRAVFCFGYGPVTLSDHRLGDTPLSDYDEVEIEVREGLATDLPISLYPKQVYEESVGVELVMPYPRDDMGEVIDDSEPEQKPQVRRTGADASACSVIIQFGGGLYNADTKTGDLGDLTVEIRVRRRLVGATSWTTVDTLKITNDTQSSFSRQFTFKFPQRGRWEIELTRMTPDHEGSKDKVSRSTWVCLQTLRPEYPINMRKALCLVGIRIKATYQLNGGLDAYNALAQRRCLDYDAASGTWLMRETRNPASHYRLALQGPANARAQSDSQINLAELADFHDFCRVKGLKYDRVHDFEGTLGDSLKAICAAGRAAPRHDGLRYGVIIDRPQAILVDELTPRNAYDWQTARTYIDPPHAFRVPFLDSTNDFQPAERLVRWPGYDGPIDITEEIQLPGKTDPDEIYREAKRRMYELLHRLDTYQISQDGALRVLTRGDLAACSFPTLRRTQVGARVLAIQGRRVELDEMVEMVAGKTYALRWRRFAGAGDVIGTSVVQALETIPGESRAITVSGTDALPPIGELVQVGEQALEIYQMRVAGIEAGDGLSAVLRLVDAAPEIDTLTDALVIPAWSGRVGAEINPGVLKPAVPRITAIKTGTSGTGVAGGLDVRVEPGSGSAAIVNRYEISHRKAGVTAWTKLTVPAADGGAKIRAYAQGNAVQLSVKAISVDDDYSDATTTVSFVVGQKDAVLPPALPDGATVAGGMGNASLRFATGPSTITKQVQLYRVPAGAALNRALHAAGDPVATRPSTTITTVDGDATRTSLLAQGDFSGSDKWTLGDGWSIGANRASHAPAQAPALLSQAVTVTTGKVYRIGWTIVTINQGTIVPMLTGGSSVSGPVVASAGRAFARLQAVTGNDTVGLSASVDLTAAIDDVVLFEETESCVAQGDYDYYIEPQNADGAPGPVSGPLRATVV